MRLLYDDSKLEVKVGDFIADTCDDGRTGYRIRYFRKPHKPSSSGKVSVSVVYNDGFESEYQREYYVGVIGATWIEREDRQAEDLADCCDECGKNVGEDNLHCIDGHMAYCDECAKVVIP